MYSKRGRGKWLLNKNLARSGVWYDLCSVSRRIADGPLEILRSTLLHLWAFRVCAHSISWAVWIPYKVRLIPTSALFQEKTIIETSSMFSLSILGMFTTCAAAVQRGKRVDESVSTRAAQRGVAFFIVGEVLDVSLLSIFPSVVLRFVGSCFC